MYSKEMFKFTKSDIYILIVGFLVVVVFFLGGPTDEFKDATVDTKTGNLAIIYFDQNLILSCYNDDAELVWTTIVDDNSGGRATCCLWYDDADLMLDIKSGESTVMKFSSKDGSLISKVIYEERSERKPTISKWKKDGVQRCFKSENLEYIYDSPNYFSRRFLLQSKKMIMVISDQTSVCIWEGEKHWAFR